MNKLYQDLVRARAAAAVAEARVLRGVDHNGLVGTLREIVVNQLLQPFLPPSMGIASGAVIDHTGKQSRQCDLIVYNRETLPPVLLKEMGLVPLESALAVIEVKSNLDLGELRKAHENAALIASFQAVPGDRNGDAVPAPLRAVLAFASDLSATGKTELTRYQELVPDPRLRRLDQLCVVGRGLWFRRSVDPNTVLPREGGSVATEWISWPGTVELDELLGFLTILHNTLPVIAEKRGRPRIGRYLSDF